MAINSVNKGDMFEIFRLAVNEVIAKGNSVVLNKIDGDAPPTATDDSSLGYSLGSVWIEHIEEDGNPGNIIDRKVYMNVVDTIGQAAWLLITLDQNAFGSLSSQDADNVSISGGSITNLTDPLPISAGGTGQKTKDNVRADLELYKKNEIDSKLRDQIIKFNIALG